MTDTPNHSTILLEVMGIAGAGKSTLVRALHQRRGELPGVSGPVEMDRDAPRGPLGSLSTWPHTPWQLRCHYHAWGYLRHTRADGAIGARSAGPRRAYRRFRHRLAQVCSALSDAEPQVLLSERGLRESLMKDLTMPEHTPALAHLRTLWAHLTTRLPIHLIWVQCDADTAHARARQRAAANPARAHERAAGPQGLAFIQDMQHQHERFIDQVQTAGGSVIPISVQTAGPDAAADTLLQRLRALQPLGPPANTTSAHATIDSHAP